MLAWPDRNIQIRNHVDDSEEYLQLVSDWLEGQILFGEEGGVSLSEIVDVMEENKISSESDRCWLFIENAFNRLKQRHKMIAATSPIDFGSDNASLLQERPHTALRFCTMLALGELFRPMRIEAFIPHSERGYLFERLAENAVTTLLPRWKTVRTGWAPGRSASVESLVHAMTNDLHESPGEYTRWSSSDAKDEGLDLYCYYPFTDIHAGYPAYLIQCATGINWRKKVNKPSMPSWTKFIQFTCSPRKGFIIPFALTELDFRRYGNEIEGPLLDRYRLLSFDTPEEQWLPSELANEIESWLVPRIARLQALNQ